VSIPHTLTVRRRAELSNKVAKHLNKVSETYVAMWYDAQVDTFCFTLSSNFQHAEQDMAGSIKAMLVQDSEDEGSQDVKDIVNQFSETSSGVKALQDLNANVPSGGRLVMRKLLHAIKFNDMREAWRRHEDNADVSCAGDDDANGVDDEDKSTASVVPSHVLALRDKWASWPTTRSTDGIRGQGCCHTAQLKYCWHYNLLLSSTWSNMPSGGDGEHDDTNESSTRRIQFHKFMSSDKQVTDMSVSELLLALGVALEWRNPGVIAVLGL
jgi:hypothetical protein